jgi:hypothetical protein
MRRGIKLTITRASDLCLGASGTGFGLLRHRDDLGAGRSGRQREGRREAQRFAPRRGLFFGSRPPSAGPFDEDQAVAYAVKLLF